MMCPNCRQREATIPVRIHGRGRPMARTICYLCFGAMQSMGFDVRRTDIPSLPEWRRRLVAKDYTGGAA